LRLALVKRLTGHEDKQGACSTLLRVWRLKFEITYLQDYSKKGLQVVGGKPFENKLPYKH